MMIRKLNFQDNLALAYTEYGNPDGFPILIQHGMIASILDGDLFNSLINLGVRLICIARPGYGESSPYPMKNMAEWGDLVSVLIDQARLDCFDVFGISSGAPYSYAIADRFPNKVRNLFILSGVPALYHPRVQAFWPHPLNLGADTADLQKLAFTLFFSHCSAEDLLRNDVKDSMRNDCFGIAQDLKIRAMDWGFDLADIRQNVLMRHSRSDESFITAEITAKLLLNCQLIIQEDDPHFSPELVADFISSSMAPWYINNS